MGERERVTCGAHGESPATFTCRHVATGVACGFHASADEPDDPWPDAWCDLCDEVLTAAGGEWTDDASELAQIQVLCSHCYEAARDRNQTPPPLARATHLGDDAAARLLHHAVHTAQATQEASRARWGWGELTRWDFDHEASTLSFSDPGRPTVVADVTLAGSYSTRTHTFQWAWATLDAHDPRAAAITRLRAFGEVRGLPRLTTPNFACDEAEAWELTSLAAYLLHADGLYRAPFEHLHWFMLLSGWRTVN